MDMSKEEFISEFEPVGVKIIDHKFLGLITTSRDICCSNCGMVFTKVHRSEDFNQELDICLNSFQNPQGGCPECNPNYIHPGLR